MDKQLEQSKVPFTRQEPMGEHTSFCIGGPAAYFCAPESFDQLKTVLNLLRACNMPYFVLGKGSNVLFSDTGYPGCILHLAGEFASIAIEEKQMRAGAGADLKTLCLEAQKAGLSGLEFAYGIPGSVGGAVFMNAGAYDGEIKQVLSSVTYCDENLAVQTAQAADLQLGYRTSLFQKKSWILLEAVFQLTPGDRDEIWRRMDGHMESRKKKQPLEYPSAGSTFKRPEGAYAGALIDQSGLRGYQIGGAAVSEKHCGFVVNLGGATCADVLSLADHIVEVVKEKTGFTLEKEIRVIGG